MAHLSIFPHVGSTWRALDGTSYARIVGELEHPGKTPKERRASPEVRALLRAYAHLSGMARFRSLRWTRGEGAKLQPLVEACATAVAVLERHAAADDCLPRLLEALRLLGEHARLWTEKGGDFWLPVEDAATMLALPAGRMRERLREQFFWEVQQLGCFAASDYGKKEHRARYRGFLRGAQSAALSGRMLETRDRVHVSNCWFMRALTW